MSIELKLKHTKDSFSLDIDLSIPSRGITALFGPSGSGKTTILRAIAGLDSAKGLVKLGDEIWQSNDVFIPTHKRSLGYIFQEPSLLQHLTVEKNILFGFNRIQESERNFSPENLIQNFGISSLLKRYPKSLSGGEKQKVAIVMALLASPKLLLMDEPMSALDQESKSEIIHSLENLQKTNPIPILYVSHSKSEVMRLADTLVLINEGKITANGPINDILTRNDLPLSHSKDAEVIIETTVASHNREFHLTELSFNGGIFQVPYRNSEIGQKMRLRVSAKDVSLSQSSHEDSTILNIFPAVVDQVTLSEDANATVMLKVADTNILSRISRKSAHRLSIEKGQKLFAQIKAVALLD